MFSNLNQCRHQNLVFTDCCSNINFANAEKHTKSDNRSKFHRGQKNDVGIVAVF